MLALRDHDPFTPPYTLLVMPIVPHLRNPILFLLPLLAIVSGVAAAEPIVPIMQISSKAHDSVPFDIPLPLTGAAGVECRGDSGEHQIVIEFGNPVTVASATVSSGVGTVDKYFVDGSIATVNLIGVADGQRLTVTLVGVSDGTISNDVIVPMNVLAGDTLANGTVDPFDADHVVGQMGQPVSISNFRTDVTLNEVIDSLDKKFVKHRSGNSVSVEFPKPDLLATGYSSASLVLHSNGTVSSWGEMPGDGTMQSRSYPSPLPALTNPISVSAGDSHSAALAANAVVWSWGVNSEGQLGDGTTTSRASPVAVLSNVISVKAGGFHTLALLQDGTVAAWGENSYGQLGNGGVTNSATPVAVNGLTGVTQIAAGFRRSLAVQSGLVWTWGYQFEDPENPGIVFYTEPVQVDNLTYVVGIAAGLGHAVALKNGGWVSTWGNNSSGELGDGSTTYSAIPVEVPISNVVAVSTSYDHTLALLADGTVMGWGSNEFGQLGIGSDGDFSTIPVQVTPLTNIVAIVAAQSYSMALQADGTVWAWGAAGSAIGLASTGNTTSPQQVVLGLLDQNSNAMDDRWELHHFGNLDQTAEGDYDGDGLSNLQEFQTYHTNPTSSDTDFDGCSDSEETFAATDPNDPSSYPPKLRGVSRFLEMIHHQTFGHLRWWLQTPWPSPPEESEDITPMPFLAELGGILAARVPYPVLQRSAGFYNSVASSFAGNLDLAWVEQNRFWLHRFPATNVEARKKIIFVKWRQFQHVWEAAAEARVETMVIAPGQTTSDPIDSISNCFTQTQTDRTQWEPEFVMEGFIPVEIETVSFGGDDNNYWELTSDDGRTAYAAPQWLDRDNDSDATNLAIGEHNRAVAFTRNTKPKIGAVFKLPALSIWAPLLPIKIRAHGSDGIEIPATTPNVQGEYTTLPLTPSTTELPDMVKYYNGNDGSAFTLTWEMSFDGGSTWIELGVTKHTVYLTLAAPLTGFRQETIANIGSRNANAATSASQAVAAIWQDFAEVPLEVNRVGTTSPMEYWGNWAATPAATVETPNCFSVDGLLLKGDGRCAAWMRFFDSVLKFQGIEGSETQELTTFDIIVEEETWTGDGFCIKDWNVNSIPPAPLYGIAGQGNPNPWSEFENHGVVTYMTEVYDPSYGKKHAGQSAWEDASVDIFRYLDSVGERQGALNNPNLQSLMAPHP
jgi:hypothetical protein